MRIGLAIMIPAVMTLTVAGSSLAGTATPVAATHISRVNLLADGSGSSTSGIMYHW
jgi:hypothetical protein